MRVVAALAVALSLWTVDHRIGLRTVQPSKGVLTSADLKYQGALRVPGSPVDTAGAYGGMSGRQVGGDTHLFIYGHAGSSSPPDVYEIKVNGFTPSTSSPPRTTLVTNWGDVTGGKRLSWTAEGVAESMPGLGALMAGLYWNESLKQLFWGYHFSYVDANWYTVGFSTLDDPTGPAVTAYGPFRHTATMQNAVNGNKSRRGSVAHNWMAGYAPNGKAMMFGESKSGNNGIPWGPSLFESDWPTTSTPGGKGSKEIAQTEYLYYYFPSLTIGTGALQGPLRSFQFKNSSLTYAHEPGFRPITKVDPSVNGGVASWTDEMSGVQGGIWINGTNKDGVLFFGKGPYTTNPDSKDCTPGTGAAHEWYRNAGQAYIQVASSAKFAEGGSNIVGGTSETSIPPSYIGNGYIGLGNGSRAYTVGETVTQSSSRASSTVLAYKNNDTCSHGCACVLCATGPSTTAQVPLIFFFDPATLLGIHSGSLTDYQQSAVDVVNAQATYSNFSTACNGTSGQTPASLFAGSLSGAYMTGSTLYVLANDGYHAAGCNSPESLIHVFTVDDGPAPNPQPWTLPLAVGVLVWAACGLRSSRSQRS